MKIVAQYRGGISAIFTVPDDILAIDFIKLASKLGEVIGLKFA